MAESWGGVWIYISENCNSAHVHKFLLGYISKVDSGGKGKGIKHCDNRHVQPFLLCYVWKGACDGNTRGSTEELQERNKWYYDGKVKLQLKV